MKKLFTIILDFKNHLFCVDQPAETVAEALRLLRLPPGEFSAAGELAREVVEEVRQELQARPTAPVKVNGLTDVWSLAVLAGEDEELVLLTVCKRSGKEIDLASFGKHDARFGTASIPHSRRRDLYLFVLNVGEETSLDQVSARSLPDALASWRQMQDQKEREAYHPPSSVLEKLVQRLSVSDAQSGIWKASLPKKAEVVVVRQIHV